MKKRTPKDRQESRVGRVRPQNGADCGEITAFFENAVGFDTFAKKRREKARALSRWESDGGRAA